MLDTDGIRGIIAQTVDIRSMPVGRELAAVQIETHQARCLGCDPQRGSRVLSDVIDPRLVQRIAGFVDPETRGSLVKFVQAIFGSNPYNAFMVD